MASSFKLGNDEIDERKRLMNLLFLGDSYTGKTFIIKSLNYLIPDQNYIPTMGLQYTHNEYRIIISDNETRAFYLDILDTSGKEQFKMITLLGLKQRNFDGIVLVYSTKNRESFINLESKWIKLILDNININDINLLIIVNKYNYGEKNIIDEVSEKEGEDLAKKYGASFTIYQGQNDNKNIEKNLIRKILTKKIKNIFLILEFIK